MPTPTVYVTCSCHNLYEGMTREQIITAIEQAVNEGTISNIDAGFITKIKEKNANSQMEFWVGTTAEFNAIETKAEDTLYILTDDDTADELDDIATALNGIIAGTTSVPNATNAVNATNATNAVNTSFTNSEWVQGGLFQEYAPNLYHADVDIEFQHGKTYLVALYASQMVNDVRNISMQGTCIAYAETVAAVGWVTGGGCVMTVIGTAGARVQVGVSVEKNDLHSYVNMQIFSGTLDTNTYDYSVKVKEIK